MLYFCNIVGCIHVSFYFFCRVYGLDAVIGIRCNIFVLHINIDYKCKTQKLLQSHLIRNSNNYLSRIQHNTDKYDIIQMVSNLKFIAGGISNLFHLVFLKTRQLETQTVENNIQNDNKIVINNCNIFLSSANHKVHQIASSFRTGSLILVPHVHIQVLLQRFHPVHNYTLGPVSWMSKLASNQVKISLILLTQVPFYSNGDLSTYHFNLIAAFLSN